VSSHGSIVKLSRSPSEYLVSIASIPFRRKVRENRVNFLRSPVRPRLLRRVIVLDPTRRRLENRIFF